MKKYVLALLLLQINSVMAIEQIDQRQNVDMPSEMRSLYLTNMRDHLVSLDLIIAALAKNNLSEAAAIAEMKLGVGHGKKRECEVEQDGKNQDLAPQGQSFGRFMPREMKMMGMQLHISANEFADVAREGNIGEAYKSLQSISSSCVACHQSFQIK